MRGQQNIKSNYRTEVSAKNQSWHLSVSMISNAVLFSSISRRIY